MATLATSALPASAPRWLRAVILCDKNLSAFYVGAAFTFAPVLMVADPWRPLVIVAWALIAVAGFWLGVLGILMATGLALVLRAGETMPDSYWDSVLTQPTARRGVGGSIASTGRVRR